jgi:hypothetical protein
MATTVQHGELKITTDQQGNSIRVSFSGDCDFRRPGEILTPLFEDLLIQSPREITLSFNDLTFMNSAMIPPIIQFINQLEARKIVGVITYDCELKWQAKSFSVLQTFVKQNKLLSVVVRPR